MPSFSKYAPGTPCWIDLMPRDPAAARDFYEGLFGWTYDVGPPEAGEYTMCKLGDKTAAGMGGQPVEGAPVQWTTYIATDDLDATTSKVKENGGSVMVEPMDVMSAGRMAVVADPTGAVVGLWQSGEHTGAGVANEPGSFAWNELATRDADKARGFYSAVFGYEIDDMPMGDGPPYGVLKVDGHEVGGVMQMGDQYPAETPSHWMSYFAVADADETAGKATGAGASVLHGPQDTPFGRMVVLADPQGAIFTVMGQQAKAEA